MSDPRAYNALYGPRGMIAMGNGILDEPQGPSGIMGYRSAPQPQPNALYGAPGPRWENNHARPNALPQRPADWAVTSGVAETISPTMGGYGLGAGMGTTYQATRDGDYGKAAEHGLPLAAAFMPGRGTGLARANFALDYYGKPVQILQNPTNGQLQGAMSRTKYKAMRRIQDSEGNTYVWDAADPALHEMVATKLGLDPKTLQLSDMIGSD